ncbi:transcription factor A, mitochondrial-like isoform X2 [Denticeps clupeoides]|nr:transcription factor A, mitochondrial-like isoform X2 [Denticeps clupeoides]XP_028822423.1 transcription factor A, mitochondrial-like isoform X2 [Denticeps clupeoides]
MRFVKQQQPVVSGQHPDVKVVEIVRKIAQQWRALTPEQKQPFQQASLQERERYKAAMEEYHAQLTPTQSAAIMSEKRLKMARRRALRKKRELTSLGKPKRPRTAFNIFMAEHFEEAKGTTMQGKMKSLMDDWKKLLANQKQVYVQLAEDDKIRYKNEMKAWEEHMVEIGREDVVRRKERAPRKVAKRGRKKSAVKAKTKSAAAKRSPANKAATGAKKTATPGKKA